MPQGVGRPLGTMMRQAGFWWFRDESTHPLLCRLSAWEKALPLSGAGGLNAHWTQGSPAFLLSMVHVCVREKTLKRKRLPLPNSRNCCVSKMLWASFLSSVKCPRSSILWFDYHSQMKERMFGDDKKLMTTVLHETAKEQWNLAPSLAWAWFPRKAQQSASISWVF